ncbi:MAG: TIGR03085 family protein [Acidimicrobiaceae bacterium]|nr:TIGR03085 family protein [Acidimicrobiaceae bacterium]|tara:strand:+ start:275 stop:919 length:645 start_codon:yes stop_codon:yes gene_type:complete
MAKHAHDERQVLCDLLTEVGPDAPTLCAGWATRHLAAHLVLRERRPDIGPGLVFGGVFARHTASATERLAGRLDWDRLVGRLRAGPPAVLRPVDDPMNLIEFFVHHEDVRRAVDGWEPRILSDECGDALWRFQRGRIPMQVRRIRDVDLSIARPGRDPVAVGRQRSAEPGRPVVVTGDPGELALYFFERRNHAVVELTGDADGVAEVRSATFGL